MTTDSLSNEIIRRVAALEREKSSAYFSRPRIQEEAWRVAVSATLNLPGLRGFWPMSSVGVAGQAVDIQGLGNHLTRNNDADFSYDGFAPYCDYNGTNEYHNITDAASANAFDIFGTEAFIEGASQGLTCGGWFQFDDAPPAAQEFLIAKWTAGANRAYLLRRRTIMDIQFSVYDGVAVVSNDTIATTTTGIWYHCAGRFDTTSGDVFAYLDGVESQTPAVFAAIVNSAADFTIGASGTPGNYLDGRASLCWLCAASLDPDTIMAHYQNTRAAYGKL